MARVLRWMVFGVAAFLLGIVLAGCEISQTFVVTTTADVVDAVPGDGVCDDGSGNCSLRGAVQEANALAGTTKVQLAAGQTYAVAIPGADEDAGATGDLDVSGSVLLAGAGATVDGAGLDRVFDVQQGGSLVAANVTITGGAVAVAAPVPVAVAQAQAVDEPATHEAYDVHGGGGIRSEGGLVLNGVTVTDNEVVVDGPDLAAMGGGIQATYVSMASSEVSGNRATGVGDPSVAAMGGGLYVQHGATITDSVLAGNVSSAEVAGGGGAVVSGFDGHPAATLTMTGTTVSDNIVQSSGPSGGGGGLFFDQGSVSGSVIVGNDVGPQPFHLGGGLMFGPDTVVSDSTIVQNRAGAAAGVLGYFMYDTDGGHISLERLTVTDNVAQGSDGGGVSLLGSTATPITYELVDSTVAANQAHEAAGLLVSNTPSLVVSDTTISGNTGYDDDGTDFDAGRVGGVRLIDSAVSFSHVTVTGNTAEASVNGVQAGGVNVDDGQLDLTNTVIGAQALGDDCATSGYPGGVIVSHGYNADSDGSCNLTEPTDQPSIVPLLGPLADNGGPTWTHLPLAGSPLIDVIPVGNNGCGVTPDQRGVPRPQGPACDVGSVEQ